MNVPVIVENKDSHNIIALHLHITAPEQASVIVTGNSTKSTHQPLNMSRSTYLSDRLSAAVAGSRTRSASTGRDKKSDLRARHWALLFENLQHAIDELYLTCEMDEIISECKEVILVLENYTRDFHNLAEWFRLKWDYDNTPPPQRPNSLTWEIRKSSPGKIFRKNGEAKFDSSACRELIFELDKVSKTNETVAGCAGGSSGASVTAGIANIKPGLPTINVVSCSIPECVDNDTKPEGVDCGCQTEDDVQLKKTPPTVARKMVINSASSYSKKQLPNFSIRAAPDRNTPIPLVLPLRRLTQCISPRKSVPGRNTAAPVFVPGKKIVMAPKTTSVSPTLDTKDSVPSTKLFMSRSQSDSVFETSSILSKSKTNAKQYASIECVTSDTTDEASSFKIPLIVESMRVINEGEVAPFAEKVTSSPNEEVVTNEHTATSQVLSSLKIRFSSSSNVEAAVTSHSASDNFPITERTTNESRAVEAEIPEVLVLPSNSAQAASLDPTAPKPTETVSIQPEPTSPAIVVATPLPLGDDVENAVPKTTASPKKTPPEDKKSSLPSIDATKRVDVKKTPHRNNLATRPIVRPGDSKVQQRPNVAERKTNFVARVPPSRAANQKYVKNVGVPKTTAAVAITATTNVVTNKGDQRSVEKPSLSPCQVKEVSRCASLPVAYAKSSAAVATPIEVTHSAVPVNYSNATKSNKETAVVVRRSTNQPPPKYGPNMIRSKTSIDMKSRLPVVPPTGSSATAPPPAPSKIATDNRDAPVRSRRSSKDSDGWETVISRSRRSIPNSLNAKEKLKHTAAFDINKRFYEPTPSASLPSLAVVDGAVSTRASKEKSPESSKSDRTAKLRNRNNSQGSTNSKEGPNGGGRGGDYNNYKLNKERPIITAMFSTITSKRKRPNEKDVKKTKPSNNSCSNNNNNSSSYNNNPRHYHHHHHHHHHHHNNNNNNNNNIVVSNSGSHNNCKRKSSKESDKQNQSDVDAVAGGLSKEEESLRKSKELHEKEIRLQKEIHELQNADAETDVEDSDCAEVDAEIAELCQRAKGAPNERRALLELKYSHVLTNMSWSEQAETLDKLVELLERDPSGKSLRFAKNFTSLQQFEDLMARWPGRALELHQKLSSPSRKRISPDRTILQHKARQAKAKLNREQLLQDKSAKIRELFNKVAEVKAMQVTLAEERRKSLDQKLKRAEENRNLHLKNIQEKAHDEAKKQKEIAFINELEAQNKRHDFYALCQEQEDRLQSILEERQRRQEEKAAKEAAVEERRKAIEAERQEKIEELQEKMRKREERIDREFQEKERERIKVAREKARDREDRLLALQAAQIANAEELQKKIQQKQENSTRRHEESIELIRQRAMEIGTPRLTPYQINKLCSVCNVVIDSEVFLLSHLKGSSHQEAVKKYREQFEANVKFSECSIIKDAPAEVLNEKKSREKERQKMLRKRCKKIRQRLNFRSEKYLKCINEKDQSKKIDSPDKRRIFKSIKDIEKLFSAQGSGIWPNNAVTMLERNLFEIIRILDKGDEGNQRSFCEFDGFTVLSKIYDLALDLPKNMSPYLPLKCFVVASNVYINACSNNVDNCLHVLLSNRIVQMLDFLLNRLNLIMPNSDDRNGMVVYKADSVADVLMNLCSIILTNVTSLTTLDMPDILYPRDDIAHHLQDVVSYTVCNGIVDKLAVYCSSVHDNKSADSFFLLHSIEILTRLVETRKDQITDKEDNTQLMATLKATELVGAVSMLYAILLHQDSMSNGTPADDTVLQSDVVNVIIATLRFFSRVCQLNLEFFQNILGAEGISLQVRHIISYLLKYCAQNKGYTNLLHQVIEFIGFFAIHHHDNQMIIQSGSTPTVLQQLSNLPFEYFSNPNLVRILFPTLLACCVDNVQNRLILDQEMSFQLLEDFRNSAKSKDIPLIKLLR